MFRGLNYFWFSFFFYELLFPLNKKDFHIMDIFFNYKDFFPFLLRMRGFIVFLDIFSQQNKKYYDTPILYKEDMRI